MFFFKRVNIILFSSCKYRFEEVLVFLNKIVDEVGFNYTEQQLKDWVWKHLKSGQVSK